MGVCACVWVCVGVWVCVCVCVRARARVCVCARMCQRVVMTTRPPMAVTASLFFLPHERNREQKQESLLMMVKFATESPLRNRNRKPVAQQN